MGSHEELLGIILKKKYSPGDLAFTQFSSHAAANLFMNQSLGFAVYSWAKSHYLQGDTGLINGVLKMHC